MRKLLSLLLGVHHNASAAEIRRQYQRVTSEIAAAAEGCSADQAQRYRTARERLECAYEKSMKQLNNSEDMYDPVSSNGTVLGELLVDAEIITHNQLAAARWAQARIKPALPLERLLVVRGLVSWEKLAYYAKLQDLLQLAPGDHERVSRQLLELGLVSHQEMDMVEMDCLTTDCSMSYAIALRGWVKSRILSLLAGSIETPANKTSGEEHRLPVVSGTFSSENWKCSPGPAPSAV